MAGCYSSLLVDEWQHFKSCVLCSVDCWALMYSFCGVACGACWCNCLMRTREKGKRKEEDDPRDDSDLFMLLFCLMCFDVLILLVVVLLVVVFVLY